MSSFEPALATYQQEFSDEWRSTRSQPTEGRKKPLWVWFAIGLVAVGALVGGGAVMKGNVAGASDHKVAIQMQEVGTTATTMDTMNEPEDVLQDDDLSMEDFESTKEIEVGLDNYAATCAAAKSLADATRLTSNANQNPLKCDKNDLANGWYKNPGFQIPTSIVPKKRCGTHAPGYIKLAAGQKLPTTPGNKVTVKVCYHWGNNGCSWNNNVEVLNCGGYYAYNLVKPPTCWLRYCFEKKGVPPPPGNGGMQYSCPPGTFEVSRSASGCVCQKCPAGSKCPGGVNAGKQLCKPGSYQPLMGQAVCKSASPGNYVSGSGAVAQSQCQPGSYQPAPGASSCRPAEKGKYVPGPGATRSQSCSPGTYQPGSGQKACLDSPAGSHVPGAGAVNPTKCKPGSYQPAKKQVQCKPASKGHYVAKEGALYQNKCPHGEYQDQMGKTSCKPASPGYVVPNPGASGQNKCPANTKQPCGGQVQCIPCPAGLGSAPGSTKCGAQQACVIPNGNKASSFAKVAAPKGGKLKSITLKYVSGLFKYCGAGSAANCQGYYGIRDGNHGFDMFFTRANYQVLFPLKGDTIGMTPKQAARFPASFPFYSMAGKNAGSTQPVTFATNRPQAVAAGEEIRVYVGEVLFNYHPADNVGKVCYTVEFNIV